MEQNVTPPKHVLLRLRHVSNGSLQHTAIEERILRFGRVSMPQHPASSASMEDGTTAMATTRRPPPHAEIADRRPTGQSLVTVVGTAISLFVGCHFQASTRSLRVSLPVTFSTPHVLPQRGCRASKGLATNHKTYGAALGTSERLLQHVSTIRNESCDTTRRAALPHWRSV